MTSYSGNFCLGAGSEIWFLPSDPVFSNTPVSVFPKQNLNFVGKQKDYFESAVIDVLSTSPTGEYALVRYNLYDNDFITLLYYLRMINLKTGAVLGEITSTNSAIYTVTWHPNGQHVVLTRASGGSFIYNYSLSLLRTINFASGSHGTAIHPIDNIMILCRANTPRILYYDVSDSNPTNWVEITTPITAPASNVITSQGMFYDEHMFIYANTTSPRVYAFRSDTWEAITHPMSFSSTQWGVAGSPDGRYICALNATVPYIHIYDRVTDTYSTPTYSGISAVFRPQFSADSKKLYIQHSPRLIVDLDTMTVTAHTLPAELGTTSLYQPPTRTNILYTYSGEVQSVTRPNIGVRSRVYISSNGLIEKTLNSTDEGLFSNLFAFDGPRQVIAAVSYQSFDIETGDPLPSVAATTIMPTQDV